MELSPAVQSVKPSITLAISAKAKAMKADGIDVIPLSAGEPDFDTPRHICDAAIEAINSGFTRYTPASGTADLKKAVADTFRTDNGLDYDPSQVIINCGAKHSVFQAVFVMVRPGEEVIIQAPYWVSYPEMVRLAGGTPVIVETTGDTGYKLTPDIYLEREVVMDIGVGVCQQRDRDVEQPGVLLFPWPSESRFCMNPPQEILRHRKCCAAQARRTRDSLPYLQ